MTSLFIPNVSGALRGEETVASLAGQPRAPSASGASHVNPHIPDQDQLSQHQTDHSRVTRGTGTRTVISSTASEGTRSLIPLTEP